MPEMPAPALYAQELITNGGGVWIGCGSRSICEQAHTPGETGDEIRELFTADQLRAYGDAREAAAVAAEREAIIALLPGGDHVDPQWVADAIRERK